MDFGSIFEKILEERLDEFWQQYLVKNLEKFLDHDENAEPLKKLLQ